jgi:putative DNA primase/helicase
METTETRGVNPEHIPEDLKQIDQWVCWRAEWNEDNSKFTKRPKKYTGDAGSSTNSSTWTTFDKALAAYERRRGLDGIGFAGFGRTDFVGIDIDNCLNPETGEIKEYARAWVDRFDSYTEVTPSGDGLRIWIRADKTPGSWCGSKSSGREFEVYANGRFFTVTGWHLAGAPMTIEHRQETSPLIVLPIAGFSLAGNRAPKRLPIAGKPHKYRINGGLATCSFCHRYSTYTSRV